MTRATAPRVLLLDLDDTLLGNPMDRFIPAYFEALTRALAAWVEPSLLLRELLAGTRAMDRGDWEWDIVQPCRLEIPAWWIADAAASLPDSHGRPVGHGDLAAFGRWLDRLP